MMAMVDLSSFADDKFDPKAWVNEACRSRHPEDPIDKHLTDLETKLQLISENIASSLEEHSAASLLKVPRASREIIRLRDDAASLRSTVSTILTKLKQAEGSCAESVAALARVDVVKQRMEAAYGTLQDAAGLAQLSANVETVFASGDLARAAETLANMRRCLSVIGEVPEFSNVRQQLEILEDRLEGMVMPKLSDALLQRKLESTQSLHDILVTIGRYGALEKQYTRVRLKPLRRVWEDYDSGKGGFASNKLSVEITPDDVAETSSLPVTDNNSHTSFADWLPQFYDEMLLYLEQEWKCCSAAFPDKYKLLVPKLLIETMSSISTSFVLRIDSSSFEILSAAGTTGDGQKNENVRHSQLGLLITLHTMTRTFARNILHLFSHIEVDDMFNVLKALYSPYEGYKERYGELELVVLTSQVLSLDFRGAVARSVGARGVEVSETVRRMEASIPAVALSLELAVERCINFTGGSESEALLQTLDEIMRLYIGKLQDMLKSLRAICVVDRSADSSKRDVNMEALTLKEVPVLDMMSDEEEWAIVQGALQILPVAENLNSQTSVFETTLCATLKSLGERLCLAKVLTNINQIVSVPSKGLTALGLLTGGSGASLYFDMAILRLIDKPDKARRLHNLFDQANDTGFHALSHTSGRVASFMDLVNDLVYDVLIAKVRARLNNVALLPVWGAEKETNIFDLPSFSAYASPHVTSMGEYLLTLPQQLEPIMIGGGGSAQALDAGNDNVDDNQLFATEWMFKVAEGATSLYVEQLRGIQFLSDRGAQQLCADIDYLCKVLSALSMQVPPILATFQACLQVPKDKLSEFIKLDSSKHLDLASAKLICKMRRISAD